jgi:intracellular sulfur oxidation DsrE/DsrF family protein
MRTVLLARLVAVVITASIGASLCNAQTTASTLTAAKSHHKVVFQVSENDPKKWELTMSNVRNVQSDMGKENVTIEVVAYGPGLAMLLLESAAANRVADAQRAGVKVVACENTMHGQKLTKEDMLSGISYVPAGVSELMLLQEAGYSYVRP